MTVGRTKRPKWLHLAIGEADRLGHHWLGCEHLLLALFADEESLVARVLSRHSLTLETAQRQVIQLLRPEEGFGQREEPGLKFTPRATLVLHLAEVEAERLGQVTALDGHVLLALMRAGQSVASRVLNGTGVELGQLRSEVLVAMQVPEETRGRYIREREKYLRSAPWTLPTRSTEPPSAEPS